MKKLLATLMVTCLALGMFTGIVSAEINPKVMVNNKEVKFDTPPVIKEGRTWVPMSAIFAQLGCDVSWDATTKTSTVRDNVSGISAKFSETTAKVPYVQTGIEKMAVLNEAPFVKNGRTYVQLNVFADIFCKDISYDSSSTTVTVNDMYSDDIIEIHEDTKTPISVEQPFKIKVSTDGTYSWKVLPNASFVYYGMTPIGVGNYYMYFKPLAHGIDSKLELSKVDSKTNKVLSTKVYTIVLKDQDKKEIPEPTVLVENKPTTLALGDTFQISLKQNSASTGYEWKTEIPTGIELVSHKITEPDKAMPGASVDEIWTFKTIKPGEYKLNFEYSRSWETEGEVPQVASYVLTVK